MKLSELAELLHPAKLVGEDVEIEALAPPGQGEQNTAEVWRKGPVDCSGPAVVEHELEVDGPVNYLRVRELDDKLPKLLYEFESELPLDGISESATIAPDFTYAEPIHVGPGAVIGPKVSCGPRTRIEAGVSIVGRTTLSSGVHLHSGVRIQCPASLGENSEIHSNTVIGADGYGYQQKKGEHVKIPQIGGVEIGGAVEIGANCTVDRGTIGETVIGTGTKIDDQVHIGHNCQIGENCLLVGKSGISGSVELGDHVIVAGQSGIKDHVKVADRVTIASRSGVTKDITEEGVTVSGYPARSHREELKQEALIRKLPEMYEKLKKIE